MLFGGVNLAQTAPGSRRAAGRRQDPAPAARTEIGQRPGVAAAPPFLQGALPNPIVPAANPHGTERFLKDFGRPLNPSNLHHEHGGF